MQTDIRQGEDPVRYNRTRLDNQSKFWLWPTLFFVSIFGICEASVDGFSDPIQTDMVKFRRFDTERLDQEPAMSPDGKRVAFINVGGQDIMRRHLWIMDSDGNNPRALTNNPAPHIECYPRWSPDGRYIAYTSDLDGETHVWIISLDGGNPIRVTDRHLGSAFGTLASWSPDSRKIAISNRTIVPNQLLIYQITPASPDTLHSGDVIHSPSWSPANDRIIYAGTLHQEGNLWSIAMDGGLPEPFDTDGKTGGYLDWSRNGQWIAFQSDPGPHIFLVSAGGGQPVRVSDPEHMSGARTVSWAFDNETVMFSGHPLGSGLQAQLVKIDTSGDNKQILTPVNEIASAPWGKPSWSPDEREIAFVRAAEDTSVCIIDLATEKVRQLVQGRSPAWSPYGDEIAFVDDDIIWTIPVDGSGEPAPVTLELTFGGPRDLVWSPDGEWLAFVMGTNIWRVSSFGGEPERIVDDISFWPSWSGDSSSLYFLTNKRTATEDGHYRSGWGDLWSVSMHDIADRKFWYRCNGFQPSVSLGGEFVAFIGFDLGSMVIDRKGSVQPKIILGESGGLVPSNPSISPTGRSVAFHLVQSWFTYSWQANVGDLIGNAPGLP